MMKRMMALVLACVSLVSITGCKKSKVLVENEKDAKEVIECSSDNMYGLEKIVVFEDRAVAVFDQKICESFKYDENNSEEFSLKGYLGKKNPGFRAYVENMVDVYPNEDKSSIEVKNGHYVVTVIFPNKESYKEDPNEDFVIWALRIGDMDIEFNEKSIELEYVARGYDVMWYYKQNFDRSKGKWDHVDEERVSCETSVTL